jgi:GNAT superfamily N-acetyltransferase
MVACDAVMFVLALTALMAVRLAVHRRVLRCDTYLFARCRNMAEAAGALEFSVRGASRVSSQHLAACAKLFSEHYGVWGVGAPARQGARVRLSASRLQEQCLFDANCCLSLATTSDGSTVGHAFAVKFQHDGVGCVSWITQLVVHSDFRSHGVASKLCQMAWDVSAVDGCGIVTSHPHAIRALEKATRRRCKPGMLNLARSLIAASHIPYLQDKTILCSPPGSMCQIDTGFFVDHISVNVLMPAQPSRLVLGPLEDGHEFVAFTLNAWTPHLGRNVSPPSTSSNDDEQRGELALRWPSSLHSDQD